MLEDLTRRTERQELVEQLSKARREQRKQEQTLAWLKYVWGIAKRLRVHARDEEEREKWHVQSDVYMGLIVQQEGVVTEITETIDRCRKRLAELDARAET